MVSRASTTSTKEGFEVSPRTIYPLGGYHPKLVYGLTADKLPLIVIHLLTVDSKFFANSCARFGAVREEQRPLSNPFHKRANIVRGGQTESAVILVSLTLTL